jgi:hypothetical protein
MFTQVYFHKTRVAFDLHLREALRELLPGGSYPTPTPSGMKEFLEWDDWKVQGHFAQGDGGEHARRIIERNHYREIYHSPEVSSEQDLNQLKRVKQKLGGLVVAEESAGKNWYTKDSTDIPVLAQGQVQPLSYFSRAISSLQKNNQVKLYVDKGSRPEAKRLLDEGV